MPVKMKFIGGKYRVVEVSTGRLAKNKGGIALDGGGHRTSGAAKAQAAAVNSSLSRKRKHGTSKKSI